MAPVHEWREEQYQKPSLSLKERKLNIWLRWTAPQQFQKSTSLIQQHTEMCADRTWTSFLHYSLKPGPLMISVGSWDHEESPLLLNAALPKQNPSNTLPEKMPGDKFLVYFFKSRLHVQGGAWTQTPEIKSYALLPEQARRPKKWILNKNTWTDSKLRAVLRSLIWYKCQ